MSMRAIRQQAQCWLQQGRPAVVVEVHRVQGSVPREAGCRMVVDAQTQLGTIGGGHLEWQALQQARQLIGQPAAAPVLERHALGPSHGQCCGGVVELRFAWLDAAEMTRWEPPAPLFHLSLYGAGHVGVAVARLLVELEVEVDWIDVRDSVFPDPRTAPWSDAPHIRRITSESPAHEAQKSPPGGLHLVMTHSHAMDFDIVETLLRRADVPWVGLIGSKTKRARFEHRLRARGLAEKRLTALCCPIGIPGIMGKAPAVVALSVVAQLCSLSGAPAQAHQSGAPLLWRQPNTSGKSSHQTDHLSPHPGGRS